MFSCTSLRFRRHPRLIRAPAVEGEGVMIIGKRIGSIGRNRGICRDPPDSTPPLPSTLPLPRQVSLTQKLLFCVVLGLLLHPFSRHQQFQLGPPSSPNEIATHPGGLPSPFLPVTLPQNLCYCCLPQGKRLTLCQLCRK